MRVAVVPVSDKRKDPRYKWFVSRFGDFVGNLTRWTRTMRGWKKRQIKVGALCLGVFHAARWVFALFGLD
jgi:hypothetical protein